MPGPLRAIAVGTAVSQLRVMGTEASPRFTTDGVDPAGRSAGGRTFSFQVPVALAESIEVDYRVTITA